MARITTHVLDAARGCPAQGVLVELFRQGKLVHSLTTNADGRTGEPLLQDTVLEATSYELRFHVGEYLRQHNDRLSEPLFLDDISIRFGVSEPTGNYHVPLLISPFGYSTYRGS